ncbi:MAG: type 1 glutamine amidotransferase domain-containing protein [Bacteroidota bacterium]
MKTVLIPIPSYGCDPSEVAIPWKLMTENNIEVVFATPTGKKAQADEIMLTGKGLGIFKSVLKARNDAVVAYNEMEISESFCNPISYDAITESDFDALFLPGGHDKSVKEYLESKTLQDAVVDFFTANKSVGAICHGVVLVARSVDPKTGVSVINNYKTTSLLKSQELMGYNMSRYKLKDYYLTYPGLTVEDEVKSVLSDEKNFISGPTPLLRDSARSINRGFIVTDKNYLSGRWPGDVYKLSVAFIDMVNK